MLSSVQGESGLASQTDSAEPSHRQSEFLRQLRSVVRRYSPDRASIEFYNYVRSIPEEERLLPEWRDFWILLKDAMPRSFPPPIVEEIERRISSIQFADEEIWKIRVSDKRVTFLLGAGASAPSGIPTVDKLLLELWRGARRIGRADLDRLANWCEERGITKIEDLMTVAYISNFVAANRSITSLFDYFLFSGGGRPAEEYASSQRPRHSEVNISSISFLQDTPQTLFGLLTSTMISAIPNPIHTSIVEFAKQYEKATIVTTNYDGCTDEAARGDLDFDEPKPVLNRTASEAIRSQVLSLTTAEARKCGIRKNTFWHLQHRAKTGKSFKIYGKTTMKLQTKL